MKIYPCVLMTAVTFLGACQQATSRQPGPDLTAALARAQQGRPLRYVAIGGSITQAGRGWIGDWLHEQFPQSTVLVTNSGMSATGSGLGVFRVARDVIACQPDLVAIEYAVNDGDQTDESAIHNVESLVVRLKSLPQPPAIILLEVAQRGGVNQARHHKVAQHYGLIEVDLQRAADDYLRKTGQPWETLFTDDVHCNDAGNAFYTQTIAAQLQTWVNLVKARKFIPQDLETPPVSKLPAPLSTKPLLLDGRLTTLTEVPGWKKAPSPANWWGMFFQGVITATDPGATYVLPFRGTTVGLFYDLDASYGSFYASIDGGLPVQVMTNLRSGYDYTVLARDLPAREHLLTIVLPAPEPAAAAPVKINGPVKFGYALFAGATMASREPSPQGKYSAAVLRELSFTPITAREWSWLGPYPVTSTEASNIHLKFPNKIPGATSHPTEAPPTASSLDWYPLTGTDALIDFWQITGSKQSSVTYAQAPIQRTAAGKALLRFSVDYFAKIWINGELVATFDHSHGGSVAPNLIPVYLRQGANTIVVKTAAGSRGHNFSLAISKENQVP